MRKADLRAGAVSRGHTPPRFRHCHSTRPRGDRTDARSALDLSLLLDVIAGPDPMEAGTAYKLALPPSRHGALKNFRVLVINTDPVMPTNAVVRAAIDKLAANLGKAGVKSTARARYCRTSPRHRGFTCGC